MIRDASDLLKMIRRVASDSLGNVRSAFKSLSDPSYVSGNLKTKRPGESAAANKTKKILLAYGTKRAAASDSIVEIPVGNDTILAAIGDVGTFDADTWLGVSWVAPSSTNTLDSANTERNTTSTTFVEVKRFNLSFPGRYRVAMELARSANTTEAKLQLLLLDGATWVDASTVATSVSTHPTFSSVSMDMNVTANCAGMILRVVYRNDIGGTSYIKNVSVKYAQATATLTLYHAVQLD